MATNNIRQIRSIMYASLAANNLGRALEQLKILAKPAEMQAVEDIQSNYSAMLSYKFNGIDDPDADNVYNHLIKQTYELIDNVCAPHMQFYHCGNQVFAQLWNCYRFGDEQNDYCRVMNEQGTELNNCIAVSAITLSCLRIFDEAKMHALIDFCSNYSKKTAARALTGLVLCLIVHNNRIAYYPATNNKLNLLFDNEENVALAKQIVVNFIRCKENQRITKDIKDNILPTLSKIAPEIQNKIRDNFDSDDYEESMYGIQDMIVDSGIADKMQQYSELQLEGSDINYSTLGTMKKFGFFQNIDSWFLPFYKENPAIADLFNEAEGASFLDFLAAGDLLCDSDKYSFCVNLTMVPQEMRASMQKQLKAQIGEAPKNETANDMGAYTNRYMQDIYRFYKLFRDKDSFDDIFEMDCDVYNMEFFRFLDTDGSFLKKLADFCLSKELYPTALGAYNMIAEHSPINAALYKKIGFCLQKNKQYAEAAEYYKKVELMDGGGVSLYKSLGYCLRKSGNFTSALEYYTKASEAEPENLNLLFNVAVCHTELHNYEKALNYLYKIEFLHSDNILLSPRVNLYFGICQWACGDKKGAIKHLMQANQKNDLEASLRRSPYPFTNKDIYMIMDYIRYFSKLIKSSEDEK